MNIHSIFKPLEEIEQSLADLYKSLIAADRQHLDGLIEFARARCFEDLASSPLPRFPNL